MRVKPDFCIHFNGIQNRVCDAGIQYSDIGILSALPCMPHTNPGGLVTCTQWTLPTQEQVDEGERKLQEYMRTEREDSALIATAHRSGLYTRPNGTSLVFVCEVCTRGTRQLFRTGDEIFIHLREVHEQKIATVTMKLLNHMDSTEWYEWNHAFYEGDLHLLTRSVRSPRRGENKTL